MVSYKTNNNTDNSNVAADVCLDMQCERGARCRVSKSPLGELVPECTCEAIANPDRLPYTFGCKKATDGEHDGLEFSNKEDVRRSMCKYEQDYLSFTDVCEDETGTGRFV